MSYKDLIPKLNDPLSADLALDHEITQTVINIHDQQKQILPTTPITTIKNDLPNQTQTQSRRMNRRVNYALLNQFLLHCELGHILHINKFIKHPNIDIDYQNSHGHTPAMIAIIHNRSTQNTSKLVQKLIDGGIDADITDYDGKTIFNYACDNKREDVLFTLISCGINTYHKLLPTLSLIQNNGLLNILYTLIMHFAIEKEFTPRCGVCNHALIEQHSNSINSSLICCIGMKSIKMNSVYYKCGSNGCWGKFIVCDQCNEYGIIKFMMDITRQKKYNSLTNLEKYEVDKQIKKYFNYKNQNKNNSNKNKGIHVYTKYPNRRDENIHSPIANSKTNFNYLIPNDPMLMYDFNQNNQNNNKQDDSDSDSDSDDDSDTDSDDNSDDDNDKNNQKDPNDPPNFNQGNGKNFMNYILTKQEYWFGKSVLTEKEWREIYWMDLNMQLKWLILLRRNIVHTIRECLNDFDLPNSQIVNEIITMICGTCTVSGCFVNVK